MEYERVFDANNKPYKRLQDGTCYTWATEDTMIALLEQYRGGERPRLIFSFGDTKTGRDWQEIHNTEGSIGRSTGDIKIPLLIYNARSYGGGALLTDCIVKIRQARGKRVIYQHPKYHL